MFRDIQIEKKYICAFLLTYCEKRKSIIVVRIFLDHILYLEEKKKKAQSMDGV